MFRYRQSSLTSPCAMNSYVHGGRTSTMSCTQLGANSCAWRVPVHDGAGCGSRQRRSPTGGAAYGTPRKTVMAALRSAGTPESRPCATRTSPSSATTGASGPWPRSGSARAAAAVRTASVVRIRSGMASGQLPDADVAPAPEAAGHPARSAVHLKRDRPFGDAADGAVGRVLEVGDQHVVDPDRDVRHFTGHPDADGVPVVALPGLHPRGAGLIALTEAGRRTGRRTALPRAAAPCTTLSRRTGAPGPSRTCRQLHAAFANHGAHAA